MLGLELEIVEAEEAIRSNDARVGQNRERIAAYEATIDHQRRLSADLEQEVARYRRQLTAMSLRAGNLDDQLRETVRALAAAEEEHRERARRVGDRERTLTDFTRELDELQARNEQDRAEHLQQLRAASVLGNQISALESRSLAAAGGLRAWRRPPGRTENGARCSGRRIGRPPGTVGPGHCRARPAAARARRTASPG